MNYKLSLIFVLLFGILRGAIADSEDIWLKTFYRTQEIKNFDKFWKKVVAEKILENKNAAPPTLGFACQVIHQHPDLLKGRFDDLKKFPSGQLPMIVDLLWESDTPEAREILKANGYTDILARPIPPIGTKPITVAGDLDFCWGWFFATGDTAALNPIISALDFGKYAGAAKNYQSSKKTAADRDAAYKDAMFGAALWSLGANGKDDEKITNYIEAVFANPETPKSRTMWLAVVLGKLKPEKYQVALSKNAQNEAATMTITTPGSPAGGESIGSTKELEALKVSLANVAKHAKDYPPQFASKKERKEIEAELRKIMAALAGFVGQHPNDSQLLFLDGFANAMAHNLDFNGAADRCIASYERLLELQPENGTAQFYFGGFLASTAIHQKESIPHLEKAIALGVTEAHFTLGFALLSIEDKTGALEHLREYARLYPNDQRVKKVIEHVEKSEFKIQRTGGGKSSNSG